MLCLVGLHFGSVGCLESDLMRLWSHDTCGISSLLDVIMVKE